MMTALRKAAKHRDCLVRLPGCQGRIDTTILAHLGGAGMARKRHDIIAAHCCHHCHDRIDGRAKAYDWGGDQMPRKDLRTAHLEGIVRTIEALLEQGIIEIVIHGEKI